MPAVPNTGKGAEQQECLFILVEMQKDTEVLQDSLAVSYKSKQGRTIKSSNSTPTYLSKGVEDLPPPPHTNLHKNDSSGFINNCQNQTHI